MLHLHLWTTPNGFKPLIMLEELGVPHTLHAVDIGSNVQKSPAFLALNPNGRIPALVDDEAGGVTVFESGAILIYLAEKFGRFLPSAGSEMERTSERSKRGQDRADVMSWLMWQMAGVGPMFGQAYHFVNAKRDDNYGAERYSKEAHRLLTVLESRLANHDFMAAEYSIADMATLPWIRIVGGLGLSLENFPGIARWVQRLEARPAVARALAWKP
jgi:GSH-dependent disulfide-bond oxidoreductase